MRHSTSTYELWWSGIQKHLVIQYINLLFALQLAPAGTENELMWILILNDLQNVWGKHNLGFFFCLSVLQLDLRLSIPRTGVRSDPSKKSHRSMCKLYCTLIACGGTLTLVCSFAQLLVVGCLLHKIQYSFAQSSISQRVGLGIDFSFSLRGRQIKCWGLQITDLNVKLSLVFNFMHYLHKSTQSTGPMIIMWVQNNPQV